MDVQRNEERHRFELVTDAGTAILEYSEPREGVLDLQHTFVPPAARGAGVGDVLVRAALDNARESGERVIPTCPYVAAWIGRHREYRDLLESADRGAAEAAG